MSTMHCGLIATFFIAIKCIVGAPSHEEAKLLFDNNPYVREVRRPTELRKFIDGVAASPDCAEASRIILLYSAWCPHCHAFAPTWSQLGADLHCQSNVGKLDISAFECVGSHKSRVDSTSEWKQSFATAFPEQDNDEIVTPREMCDTLVDAYFPTITAAVSANCTLKLPFEQFEPKEGLVSKDVRLYHLPVESHSTTLPTLIRTLTEAGIARDCQSHRLSQDEEDKLILTWLKTSGMSAPTNDDTPRWDLQAVEVNPDARLHDTVLGIYHILESWVFAEQVHLTEDQQVALKNFLLVVATSLTDSASKLNLFRLLEFIDKAGTDLKAEDYHTQVQKIKLLGIEHIDTPEDPTFKSLTCHTSSCTVWLMFHTLAQLRHTSLQRLTSNSRSQLMLPIFHEDQATDTLTQDAFEQMGTDDSGEQLARFHITADDFTTALDQIVVAFFNCKTCRAHFHKSWKDCEADRCEMTQNGAKSVAPYSITGTSDPDLLEAEGLILWLWRFHNVVNVRTATDKSLNELRLAFDRDPDLKLDHTLLFKDQDVRLPNVTLCENCRLAGRKDFKLSTSWFSDFVEGGMDESQTNYDRHHDFDVKEVLDFLQRFYFKPMWFAEGQVPTFRWNDDTKSFDINFVERLEPVKPRDSDRALRFPGSPSHLRKMLPGLQNYVRVVNN